MPKEMDQSAFEIDDPPSVGTMPTAPADGSISMNGIRQLGNTLYNGVEAHNSISFGASRNTISQATADQLQNSRRLLQQPVLRSSVPHYDMTASDAPTVARSVVSDWRDQPPAECCIGYKYTYPLCSRFTRIGYGTW